jgi:hypothetical protein
MAHDETGDIPSGCPTTEACVHPARPRQFISHLGSASNQHHALPETALPRQFVQPSHVLCMDLGMGDNR